MKGIEIRKIREEVEQLEVKRHLRWNEDEAHSLVWN
jgi:hypothetical protein